MVVTEKQKLRWGEKADNYNQITIKSKRKQEANQQEIKPVHVKKKDL